MSGMTALVVGLSLRASGVSTTAVAEPARVVQPASSPATGGTDPAAAPEPTDSEATAPPAPRATRRPTAPPTTTHPPATRARVNGQSVDTRYGPVQVQVVIEAGRILHSDAIDYPQGSGRDREINTTAVPQLDSEVLAAQSAAIDTVTGATYTSGGYRRSLQSALDAAHAAGLR